MAYRNKTYVIFDADNDIWAYGRMKGWNALPSIPFNFDDAHNLGPELTDRASEATVKRALRQRFSNAKNVVVLIGLKTRNLYRYVRWELDVALQLDLPIIAVNLNGRRTIDYGLCPPVIRDEYVVHIPFKLAIIKYALGQFPGQYAQRGLGARGLLYYPDKVYQDLDLAPVTLSPPPVRPISPPPFRLDPRRSLTNLFSSPDQTFCELLGYSSPEPPAPTRIIPPPPAYRSLASLLSSAPVAPPLPRNWSLADLLRPDSKTPSPPFPRLKKLGE